ncbi:SCO-spondin-like [Uloborus diversus]|uniref:SCO-spondin-like n=1 Tax=Uloborus diversus TaxID=327109 RepID=UPI0024099EB7|nr:SCO-spondin-like [Uloborus diversus]
MRSLLFVVICSVICNEAVTGTHKSKPGGYKKKQCGRDEQYYDHIPDCKNTCENYDNPAVLCAIGKPGCFCREGLVKRKDGKCVPPRECPRGGQNCKKDEQYYEAMPSCKNTCENYNNPGVRCAPGPPGCFCKEGLVKRKCGKCVKPCDCGNGYKKKPTHSPGTRPPKPQCSMPKCDEGCTINYKSKPCPSCDCKNKPPGGKKPTHGPGTRPPKPHCSMPKCDEGCTINFKSKPCPSCDCKHKPPGGKKPTHGPGKKPTHGPGTKPTHHPGKKPTHGPGKKPTHGPGKKPTHRPGKKPTHGPGKKPTHGPGKKPTHGPGKKPTHGPGKKPTHGPGKKPTHGPGKKPTHGPGKKPTHGPATRPPKHCSMPKCDEGCTIDYKSKPCPSCDCRNKSPESCGKNQVYKPCGSACPPTCENKGKSVRCTRQCVAGCFCKNGLVKDSNGKCVKLYDCKKAGKKPPGHHPPTHRPPHCDRLKCGKGCHIDYSTKPCPSCKCKGGTGSCGKEEVYQQCGSACPPTCKSQGKPARCTMQCVAGCFCKGKMVRNEQGRCVNPRDCKKGNNCPAIDCAEGCWLDESAKPCPRCVCDDDGEGGQNPPTGQPPVQCSPPKCSKGCKIDYSTKPCPSCKCHNSPGSCGKDEVFQQCGSACPPTCKNQGKPARCTMQCVAGCFCKGKMVRNEQGRCVNPRDCKKENNCPAIDCAEGCWLDESAKPCPRCVCDDDEEGGQNPPTGQPPVQCSPPKCSKGCKIDYSTKPCPSCKCHNSIGQKCGKNEKYSTCVNPCNGCDIRGKCNFLVCNKGCDCIKNYHRDSKGKCIPLSKCPPKGGENPPTGQPPVQCDPPKCPKVCKIDYSTKPCPSCKCQNSPGKCGKNEEYSDCGTHCPLTCKEPEPRPCNRKCARGCFCKKGYVRADDGTCVKPENCPKEQSK